MHSKNFLPLIGSLVLTKSILGQGVYRDTLVTDSVVKVYNAHFDIPIGETFFEKNPVSGYSIIKAWSSNPQIAPSVQMHQVADEVSCYFSWGAPGGSNSEATFVDNNQQGKKIVRNSISNLDSYGDPSQNIMDLHADPGAPFNLHMKLGTGSTRIDLSGLEVQSVDISSGESDLIISFSQPNKTNMKELKVQAGMSSVLLRNVEYSRAEKVRIENGMGETTLIIGDNYRYPSHIDLEVGAGTCKIFLNKNTPLKITVRNSNIAPPTGFVKSGENEFVNSAYQSKPAGACQVYVDLGVGTLEVVTDNQ